jgi:hypothetical protein
VRYLPPLGLTAVALAATYLTCIRPMRRGRHRHATAGESTVQAEIRRLREEVQLLQHELDLRTSDPGSPQQQRR